MVKAELATNILRNYYCRIYSCKLWDKKKKKKEITVVIFKVHWLVVIDEPYYFEFYSIKAYFHHVKKKVNHVTSCLECLTIWNKLGLFDVAKNADYFSNLWSKVGVLRFISVYKINMVMPKNNACFVYD